MSRQNLQFTAKDAALRDDVRELGELVGNVLRDQGGEMLFGLVEQDRQTAIRWREGDAEAAVDLAVRTCGRDASVARDLVRAFSTWFQVVNLAEKVHRIRRRREYLNRSDRPQPGGIADCFFRLRALGVTQDQLLEHLRGLVIYPVLTAHPMESTRRTILRKQQRIAQLMIERLNPTLTPAERRVTWENIRGEVTSGWQTEDHPRARLTVADEREHVLFYLAEVIYRIVPPLYEEIEIALEHAYGMPVGSVEIPCVLRFGSWVGGDMDGNPDVHAKTIRETLHRQQQVILSTYYDECLALARKLSQSDSRIDISRRLQARIGEYTTMLPQAQATTAARHDRMPYRMFMGQVAERLRTTYDGRPNHYENVGQFIADIELVAESLRENHGRHAGLFHVERLIRRARTFGFHLATLDVRQHADVHRNVVGQGLGDAAWAGRDRAERARVLSEALTSDRGPVAPMDPIGRRTLAVFEAMAQARHRFGPRAVGEYVVSGCEGVDDVLSVLLLARWADVTDKKTGQVPLDVVPLFETVDALAGCADTFRALHAEPVYGAHAEARGHRQTVMIGYADTAKESGVAAARFAVYEAQASLVAAARELGTGLSIFHGRSAAIGRGGRTESLVRGAPPGAVHGELRVSEQGEVIHNNYGLRAIAMRTFEQAVHSVMLFTATAGNRKPADPRFLDAMACMARASRARYRDLVHGAPGFYEFFRDVTPIDVIERMQLGSRPASRPERAGLAGLRTVPWVFAWTQSRHMLPGWFGVGAGLEAMAREHGPEIIARMHAEWPFFSSLLADVEFQLAKGDRGVFEHYDALAPAALAPYAEQIRAEHALATRWVTWAKGEVDLMDSDPVLQRTVLLRTPYLDPMHLMQIDLLRRWRASGREDEAVFRALIASVSGIAQGLQAAG